MKMKKYFAAWAVSCMALSGAVFVLPAGTVSAAAAPAAATSNAQAPIWYQHTSTAYGYTIDCPQRPVGVIPASTMFEGKNGEILIFKNDGYNIQKGWVILSDAFTDKDIPQLEKLTTDQQKALIKRLMGNGYEFVRLADLEGSKTKGVYAVTAKEVDIDTDGDGKPDAVAKADTQMIETFFRGAQGGHYEVILLDNPVLTKEGVKEYQTGINSFKEMTAKEKTEALAKEKARTAAKAGVKAEAKK